MGASYVSASLSLWSPARRLTPRCAWSSLSVTEITPAEALRFPVPVQWTDYTAQWKTAGFNLYLWRQCSSSLPFYSAHFVAGSLMFALLCTLPHPLHLPHSWQSFSCLLLSPPHPHSLPFFQPPLCSHSRVALYPTSEYQHSLSRSNEEKNNDLFFRPRLAEWPLPSPLSALPVPFFYLTFFPFCCKVSSTLFHLLLSYTSQSNSSINYNSIYQSILQNHQHTLLAVLFPTVSSHWGCVCPLKSKAKLPPVIDCSVIPQ